MVEGNSDSSDHDPAETYRTRIEQSEILLSCADLDETLSFYTDTLGFRVDEIFPADAPHTAVISGYGTRIRLQINDRANTGRLRLHCSGSIDQTLTAPNGVEIELVSSNRPLTIPTEDASFVHTKLSESSAWNVGRAGMRYRDLIPNRQGGRFIASHIHIPEGGPVPDYVHFHKVRFQMIYCYKGWVRLVYEDQGPEFIMHAGGAVLQPPEIRHRVLECSDNLEVVEIGCPAEHETHADHEMELPNGSVNPTRSLSGQTFVHHECDQAHWSDWRIDGLEARDLGFGTATQGLAGAYVVRPSGEVGSGTIEHEEEFLMLFLLSGRLLLDCSSEGERVFHAGDSCVLPRNFGHAFKECSADLEMLEVRFSDAFDTCTVKS